MPEKMCSAKNAHTRSFNMNYKKTEQNRTPRKYLESTVKICQVFVAAHRRMQRFDEPALGETSWGGEPADSERKMPKYHNIFTCEIWDEKHRPYCALCLFMHACGLRFHHLFTFAVFYDIFSLFCLVKLPAIHLLSFNTKYTAFTCNKMYCTNLIAAAEDDKIWTLKINRINTILKQILTFSSPHTKLYSAAWTELRKTNSKRPLRQAMLKQKETLALPVGIFLTYVCALPTFF